MSYEVDVGGLGPMTIMEDDPQHPGANDVAVGLVWPNEIAPFQWFRLSLSLNPNTNQNPPGTRLRVISESFGIQGDGQQCLAVDPCFAPGHRRIARSVHVAARHRRFVDAPHVVVT